jgi:hypothetical protein
MNQPLPVAHDTAQQKVVDDAPPRKPLPGMVNGSPILAGDSLASDQSLPAAGYAAHQKVVEEAQKRVEESAARDPPPTIEEDDADGTDQIKNWFLS